MNIRYLYIVIAHIICLALLTGFESQAQGEKEMYEAINFMTSEKYDEALGILYHMNSHTIKPFFKDSEKFSFYVDSQFVSLEKIYVKYLIAVCLLEKGEYSRKALSYIEYIMQAGYSYLPDIVFKDLGRLYYLEENFEKSHFYFNQYLAKINSSDEFYEYSKQMIDITNFARKVQKDTLFESPETFDSRFISSSQNAIVLVTKSANALFFTSTDTNQTANGNFKIMVSYRLGKYWKKPRQISFPDKLKPLVPYMKLAGLDANRENPIVVVEKGDSAIAYLCRVSDDVCIDFKKTDYNFVIPGDRYLFETENNKSLYFSGKRPDAMGGQDLYIVRKMRNGKWGKPTNLGKEINSAGDEISPFYDNEQKRLYFSTNGYQSLGGFDIQYVNIDEQLYSFPSNAGYPINSIHDDFCYQIPEALNYGFWIRSNAKKITHGNILKVNLGGTIPLTFLNGTFLAGNPPRPVAVNLVIVDKLTRLQINYTFTPDNKIGKYFAFFKPGREYDLIIDAKGYLPQTISIFVPRQSYFYEIFQEIELIPDNTDNLIQQDITVKNYFTPISNDSIMHSGKDLFNTMSNIKTVTDSLNAISESENKEKNYNDLLDLLDEAIVTSDSVLLQQLDKNSIEADITKQTTIIEKSSENFLEPVIVGKDTLYSMPRVITYDTDMKNLDILEGQTDNQNKSAGQLIFETYFYYLPEEYTLNSRFNKVIQDVALLMANKPDIWAEIAGYKQPTEGTVDLAYKRGQEIYQKLLSSNCQCRHVLIKTIENTASENITTEKLAKVRIRLYKNN